MATRAKQKPARRHRLPVTEAIQRLMTDYRLWALVPNVDRITLQMDDPENPGGDVGQIVGEVLRPTFPKGVCRKCGCSEFDACQTGAFDDPCAWTDRTRTLCTACEGR
jgi:hypothetical protein